MKRIIVGIDGSANSQAAAEAAAALARATGAPLIAVHAFGLLERMAADRSHTSSAERRQEVAEQMETEWCASLGELDVERRVVDGTAVSVLLGAADRPDDLIVVGRRGAGGYAGSSLGSTSAQVAERSGVAVLIVPERGG